MPKEIVPGDDNIISRLLVTLRFKHYSPKDSESGIAELILCDNIDQAVEYIDKKHMFGRLADDDGELIELEVTEEMKSIDDFHIHAEKYLEMDDDGVSWGTAANITRLMRGDYWEEVEDAYYGVTQYDWREYRQILEDDANVLIRLGLVTDIRTE